MEKVWTVADVALLQQHHLQIGVMGSLVLLRHVFFLKGFFLKKKKKNLVRLRLSTDVKSSFVLRNRSSDSLVNFSLVSWGLAAFAVAVYTLFKVNLLTEVSNKGKPDLC